MSFIGPGNQLSGPDMETEAESRQRRELLEKSSEMAWDYPKNNRYTIIFSF